MKSQPHVVLRRFEVFVLFPLDGLLIVLTAYYLWRHAWLLACFLFVVAILLGGIGSNLPHRKHESPAELAKPNTAFAGEFRGELSAHEARGLGKALLGVGMLICCTIAVLAWHHGLAWYACFLAAIASWLLFVLGFFAVILLARR